MDSVQGSADALGVGIPAVEPARVPATPEAVVEHHHRGSPARRAPLIVFVGDLLPALFALLVVGLDLRDVATIIISTAVALGLQRTYRHKLTLSVLDDLPKLALAAGGGVIVGGLTSHRHATLLSAVVVAAVLLVALFLGRLLSYGLIWWLRCRGTLAARTLVIGGGTIGARLTYNALAHRRLGLLPVGILDANPVPETQSLPVPLIDPVLPLSGVITTLRVDTVVVAFSEVNDLELLDTLRTCDRLDCDMLVVPRLFELSSLTSHMQIVRDIPLTPIRRAPYRTVEWRFKRIFDVCFSAAALLLLSPLLALIAVTVWLTDRSAPILYHQDRIGLDGTKFAVTKFRSLKPAPASAQASTWSTYDKSRVGRVGKILRATSLDELPQFWNVLVGDMSVVGPRPELPRFATEFEEAMRHYGARHRVPAGLTGWAAVHGLRGNTSVRERAAYDNYYIENWSLWLDGKIILRTLLAVLRRTGG